MQPRVVAPASDLRRENQVAETSLPHAAMSWLRAALCYLEDIAWILRSDPKRKQMGFVRSRDLTFEDRHRLTDDDEGEAGTEEHGALRALGAPQYR